MSSTPPTTGSAGLRRNTIIASSSSLISGMLNAAMLAISARAGETGEIAAYTVMTAALAWISILVVGGSSLLYVTGDEGQRRAVRSQRIIIVIPIMVAATAGVTLFYTDRGYGSLALITTGVVAVGNNLAELQSGDLTRHLRFFTAAITMTVTRLLALILLLAGTPLTAALAVGSVVQLLAGEVLICRGKGARPPLWHGISARSALTAFRMNRQLLTYSLAEVFTARSGSIALSMVASPRMVGYFGALTSVYQAFVAVFYGGLRVPMAVRTRRRHGLEVTSPATRDSEVMVVASAAVVAICGLFWAPWIINNLLRLPVAESATWLRLFALALPFLTINRAISLNRLGDGDYRGATRMALLIASLTAVALVIHTPQLDPMDAAGVTLTAEILAAVVIGALTLVRASHRNWRRNWRPAHRQAVRPNMSPAAARHHIRSNH